MEILIEILGEVVLEGFIEIILNKNLTKWIRYPLTILFFGFYLFIIISLGIVSFRLWNKKLIMSILLLVVNLLLVLGLSIIIKRIISNKKEK